MIFLERDLQNVLQLNTKQYLIMNSDD
jgi:hypothetical protein